MTLQQDGAPAANRLFERMRSPLLTDITVDWGGLPVADVYPEMIPDVFAAKPVVIYGRFTKPASGTVTLHGKRAGAAYEMKIAVNLPEAEKEHDVLSEFVGAEEDRPPDGRRLDRATGRRAEGRSEVADHAARAGASADDAVHVVRRGRGADGDGRRRGRKPCRFRWRCRRA